MATTKGTNHLATEYLAAVASAAPVPGGGSVAATVGALAAALAEMVCQFSVDRHEDSAVNAEIGAALSRLSSARAKLQTLSREDEHAYGNYRTASELPKSTAIEKETRRQALQMALIGAAEVPLATAEACGALLPDIEYIKTNGNPHVRSDAVIAAILADAAIRASSVNVRVNTGMLKDRDRAAALEARLEEIEARTQATSQDKPIQ